MINKTTLANGARILTEVVDGVYSASIGIYVDVGSEDEGETNNGVSHCLEHMLFKGTTKRSAQEIAQEIEDVGGSLGAATGKENTCFYGRVVGNELPVAIDLLCDMLVHHRLDPADLALERQVILEEIKMYEDDPEDLSHETMLLNVWPEHPLSRPITGTEESVSRIDHTVLKAHTDFFYRPGNIVVSIAGNFDEPRAIADLTRALTPLSPGPGKPKIDPPEIHPFTLIKDKDIEQAHLVLATQGLRVDDDRRYQLAILDLCLGGNMSSRLFQEVREKRGLVYTINTYKASHRFTGLFGVYAACNPKQVPQVLTLVTEELSRVKAEDLSETEVKRAKTQLKSELLLGLESTRSRASRNAYGELFYGRQLEVDEICRDIDKATAPEIRHLANSLIQAQHLSLVIVGPRKLLPQKLSLCL